MSIILLVLCGKWSLPRRESVRVRLWKESVCFQNKTSGKARLLLLRLWIMPKRLHFQSRMQTQDESLATNFPLQVKSCKRCWHFTLNTSWGRSPSLRTYLPSQKCPFQTHLPCPTAFRCKQHWRFQSVIENVRVCTQLATENCFNGDRCMSSRSADSFVIITEQSQQLLSVSNTKAETHGK